MTEFNPTWLYDETVEATLIDPDAPIELEHQPPKTPAGEPWFTTRTDPSATQLIPVVKPKAA